MSDAGLDDIVLSECLLQLLDLSRRLDDYKILSFLHAHTFIFNCCPWQFCHDFSKESAK